MIEINELIEEKLYSYWNGKASQEDKEAIFCWLNENPAHKEEYRKLYSLYFKIHYMGNHQYVDVHASEQRFKRALRHTKKRSIQKIFLYSGIAACLTCGVVISLLEFGQHQQEEYHPPLADIIGGYSDVTLILDDSQTITFNKDTTFEMDFNGMALKQDAQNGLTYKSQKKNDTQETITYNRIVVPRGCEYQLRLSDGTKVHLNSESQLKYPVRFHGDTREVYLTGEGFFEVAQDPLHPFFVYSGELKLQVLGTIFNISAYQDEKQIAVTLVEGKVELNTHQDKTTLTPGLQAICSKDGGMFSCHKANIDRVISWTSGMFDFADMPIKDLVVQLGRWYDVDFLITDKSIEEMRFTGVVQRSKSLKFILDFLKNTSNIIYEQQGKVIVLKTKEK